MPRVHVRPSWFLPESAATPERDYRDRRQFLRDGAALAAGALLLPALGCEDQPGDEVLAGVPKHPGEVRRNPAFKLDRPLTPEPLGAAYNNYYEFTTDKERVWRLAGKLTTSPWSIEVAGHCERTGALDFDDLLKKLPVEERLYRFRCVEAWAMAVPWIGIPMRKFLEFVKPTSKAKYVRFETVHRPEEFSYLGAEWAKERFPYYEGLRLDEADHELTLLATGLYGRAMPKQNGAPVRLIVPWKYGFKSCKSIVRIEFMERQPATFWNDAAPREYGFFANVNPAVAHPRWSQASERMIGSGERRDTLLFNGYAEQVGHLYAGMDLQKEY